MTNAFLTTTKATNTWPSYYLEGIVTHFNSAKGFGFVKCRDGREFFSWFRVVENKRLPRLGDRGEFLPSFKVAKPEITRLRYSKPTSEDKRKESGRRQRTLPALRQTSDSTSRYSARKAGGALMGMLVAATLTVG